MTDHTRDGWVVSWAASTGGATGDFAGPQATVRQSMRLSAGGGAVRLRIGNPFSYAPLILDMVTIGYPDTAHAPDLVATPFPVLFRGRRRVVVQPGEVVTSDSTEMAVAERSELVVSVFARQPAEVSSHAHANRMTWSTLSATGDHTEDISGHPYRPWSMSWTWIDAIDVRQPRPTGAVVAVGDSITDGAGSDFGTDTRWTDWLAERFAALPLADPRRRSVVNAGIGGNTLAGFGNSSVGVNVLARLDRDVLSLSGVTDVIVASGTNDLYLGGSATALMNDYKTVADRIHQQGARALIGTIAPRGRGYAWLDEHEHERTIANEWIRSQSIFDAVLDFDRALASPLVPGEIREDLDADGTHPNSAGYRAMADSIDLDFFRTPIADGRFSVHR